MALAALLLLSGRAAQAADIPTVADADVARALELAGSNALELQAALAAQAQKPWGLQAQRFVIASLPAADLGVITAAQLDENLALAQQARAAQPWGGHYDDAVFAHYVLPPRVSQEPLSGWRSFFHAELQATVARAATLEEAAVAVNRWCGSRVRFAQTQRRDQGPLVTLAGGYGRCEELCILLIAACRAVGVPARLAYCPWWAVSDNNHAWVEVLGSDGRWHFTGAAEPADTLDSAWFGGAVKSAPLIVSPCFGLPGPDEALADVLDMETAVGARHCRINSTRFYRRTGWLRVVFPQVMFSGRHPELSAQGGELVTIHVFNYGALRPVASVPIGAEGIARIELGVGDYVLTSGAPGARELRASVTADETMHVYWPAEADPSALGDFLLRFPADA